MPKPLVVIPARMGSTRFPGKPLTLLAGKPMIQWVFEACSEVSEEMEVIVATPDEDIIRACQSFGANAMLTSHAHPSGTDRLGEVARLTGAELLINVQGDEPFVESASILQLARLLEIPGTDVASLYAVCSDDEVGNPAIVKVVLDATGRALYFSRSPIPFRRNENTLPTYRHVGMYGYTRRALDFFTSQPPSPLELTEGLEQLRFLEQGFRIQMAEGSAPYFGIDTPEQAEEAQRILRERVILSS